MAGKRNRKTVSAAAVRRRACRLACRLGKRPVLDRPVFIIGCGRSGTTALGHVISVHPSVTYLNERKHLWTSAYPVTDLWSTRSRARGGRLELTEADLTPEGTRELIANFHCETVVFGGPRIVEKFPANNFRLPFLDAAMPSARFVHLLRNGLEVARSIAKMSEEGRWYGHGDRKWELLEEYAQGRPEYSELLPLCENDRLKGLLEWRMSVEAALAYLDKLPPERRMTVRYEELLDAPVATMRRIEEFAELELSEAVDRYAEANLKRRSTPIEATALSETEERLAGDLMRRLGYLES
jgi:hypothetical protein